MEVLLKICVLGLCGVICVTLLKRNAPEMGFLLAALVAAAILLIGFTVFETVAGFIGDIAAAADLQPEIVLPVLKTAGVTILTKFTADLCRDAKENAIATGVEISGSCLCLYIALPLVSSVLNLASSLMG